MSSLQGSYSKEKISSSLCKQKISINFPKYFFFNVVGNFKETDPYLEYFIKIQEKLFHFISIDIFELIVSRLRRKLFSCIEKFVHPTVDLWRCENSFRRFEKGI